MILLIKEFLEHLIEMCISFEFSITPELIENARRHQQAVLLADQGLIINPNRNTNLPKQRVQRRKLVRSKSLVQHIFAATNEHVSQYLQRLCFNELKKHI